MAVQEQDGAARLVLGRGAHLALDGEPAQVLGDLGATHLGGVTLAVVQDEAPDPADVGLLGAVAVVACAQHAPDLVEQTWRTCGWVGARRLQAVVLEEAG